MAVKGLTLIFRPVGVFTGPRLNDVLNIVCDRDFSNGGFLLKKIGELRSFPPDVFRLK